MGIHNKLNQIKNPKDLWLLLRIAAMASILPLLLRWMRLPTLLKVLQSRNSVAAPEKEQIDKIVRFSNFVFGRNVLAGKSSCLKRSLLLYHFLGKAGMEVELNFGIKKGNGLLGHCWLTSGGKIYLDNEDHITNFEVIYRSSEVK